jgi:hypothetical protein
MKPIEEIKELDLNNAFHELRKAGLLNTDFKAAGQSKEHLIEFFATCVEDADDSGKEIPDSIILFYNDIFSDEQEEENYENEEDCKGPMYFACETCGTLEECLKGELGFYLNIPYWVLEYSLKALSRSAFKIFIYLCRMANSQVGSNHFARCWLKYEQIKIATGVKSIRRYLKEVEEKDLIEHKLTVVRSPKGPKTVHQFTVNWYKRGKKFIEAVDAKRE